MNVRIWGARGSLPSPLTGRDVHAKVREALLAAGGRDLGSPEAVDRFLTQELPMSVRGTYGGNTSCVEVRQGNESIVCDAGSGLRLLGIELMEALAGAPEPCVDILLSHLHWDHIQGFPFFLPAYLPQCRIRFHGCHEALEKTLERQQCPDSFPVTLAQLPADVSFHRLDPGKDHEIGGFTVRAWEQLHPGKSYGYRITRDGKSVVYSTDSEHKSDGGDSSHRFVSYFQRADLVIFDAQYILLDAVNTKEDWGHSSNMIGVELALQAQAKRLCLFHHDPTADDATLDQLTEDTRRYVQICADQPDVMEVSVAYEGQELEL
ncbi:MAG: MBL fold metallo-hydrolase [Lentisphaerae bacterium]|jgi:phosphoribosyl 1,2-cyclic phosphodiesterase|nr:MBL fold metallo-hydrolase [Lentisphaerota bacterium]MBT4822751.1 MBL fold metallo-hydrolase [Lentisphaerota bacterium]MBT5605830.1 MBL fold metallo-hydrolase [Lentisphaerota bacterium]MBT7061303.1 MBL fold metallo-hydrolase [Lentisphaerota bacterium]MBT7846667.1 MBL fold metallo-hydrolase [Lentisphaerota bacterium]